jgi:hypothetical protein
MFFDSDERGPYIYQTKVEVLFRLGQNAQEFMVALVSLKNCWFVRCLHREQDEVFRLLVVCNQAHVNYYSIWLTVSPLVPAMPWLYSSKREWWIHGGTMVLMPRMSSKKQFDPTTKYSDNWLSQTPRLQCAAAARVIP